MIGLRPRRGRRALDRIKAAHVPIGIAAARKIADVTRVARESCIQKIRVQRDDDVGFREVVPRLDRLAERELRAFEHVVAVHRFIHVPLRLRIDLQESAQLIRERGRGNRLRQNADAGATQALLHSEGTFGFLQERRPGIHIAAIRNSLRAVRVVHAENRGLREDVGAAEAGRMLVVAFDFGGTSEMAFNQHRAGVSTQRHSGRVKPRAAGNDFFRLPDVGDDRLQRQLGATGHAGERQGSAHQLQKSAAGDGVDPFRCALGEFAVQHFLELGRAGEFLQAAPVLRATGVANLGFECGSRKADGRGPFGALRAGCPSLHVQFLAGANSLP